MCSELPRLRSALFTQKDPKQLNVTWLIAIRVKTAPSVAHPQPLKNQVLIHKSWNLQGWGWSIAVLFPGLGTWLDTITAFLAPLCVTLGDIPPSRNDPCPDGDTEKPQTQSMGRVAGISHFQPERFKETHTCK